MWPEVAGRGRRGSSMSDGNAHSSDGACVAFGAFLFFARKFCCCSTHLLVHRLPPMRASCVCRRRGWCSVFDLVAFRRRLFLLSPKKCLGKKSFSRISPRKLALSFSAHGFATKLLWLLQSPKCKTRKPLYCAWGWLPLIPLSKYVLHRLLDMLAWNWTLNLWLAQMPKMQES